MSAPTPTPYNEGFFEHISDGSRRSAQATVPLVLALISCGSVVDVGCGTGAWLRVFKEHGVKSVLGLDGDYVNRSQLQISPEEFRSADLTSPPVLDRQFDLAISLEVAEHLPLEAGARFVEYLTSLAPLVMFSAAIPGQGGTHHLNEQWPEYWAELFQKRGFATLDCLRDKLWHNENVERWYAQNLLLFVRQDYLAARPELQALAARTELGRLALVHPRTLAAARRELLELEYKARPENTSVSNALRALPAVFRSALKRRAHRNAKPSK